MSDSTSIKNLKIPYPSEGVIRTASLDDTVAPENSVQAGINVNFDRIGAFQTRKGIQTYADSLLNPIKNFGTLNNQIVLPGYERLAKYPPTNSISSSSGYPAAAKIDDTHFILFYQGFVQVAEVNLSTGVITLLGSPVAYTFGISASCAQVDANHFIIFGTDNTDGKAQVFEVDLTTFAVTAMSSPFTFAAAELVTGNSCSKVDASHVINFWGGGGGGITNQAQVFIVNLSTWAITAAGSPLTVDAASSASGAHNSCGNIDNQHFINFWASGSNVGKVRVFNVNLSTFAVTALSTALTFEATDGEFNSCAKVDASHFINFWKGGTTGSARVFAINLSTFAVTTAAALFTFTTGPAVYNSCVDMGDGEHFINFWSVANVGHAQVFAVAPITFIISASTNNLIFSAFLNKNTAILIGSYKVVVIYGNTNASPGPLKAALIGSFGEVQENNFLYAQQGDGDVLNWDNPGWVTRRTGVNPANKARFTQFLNYIWMVNGNDALFGDPVQTSNGGNFGTDLVPALFPAGDYIQAGFEGRVWVADKSNDVVYFSDIVQFTPPDVYTLTYNSEANFIKNFSPQNGQTITGLFTTPRALLLFKQDSIYRIYGAFSVDSYPAYNVGTYSQESIVQTKDGIYFHHSSGFYKFAYDSQPVEISRRVIDFVQAIPRDYYEEVKGIYDGFDAVEWHVGPITVEGVTYTSCVMRYTISTQTWTIYDYFKNDITALISYDDGSRINMIVGANTI